MNPQNLDALKKFLLMLGSGAKGAGEYGMKMGISGLKHGGQMAKEFPAGSAALAGLAGGYGAGRLTDDDDDDELEEYLRRQGGY